MHGNLRAVARRVGRIGLGPIAYRLGTPVVAPLDAHVLLDRGFCSQLGQDYLVDRHLFAGRRDGVFVDVGAHDGVTFSNSLYLERERDWRGVCIEPNPNVFPVLRANRPLATCLPYAVGPTSARVPFRVLSGPSEMLSGIDSNYGRRHRGRIDRELARDGGESVVREVEVRPLRRLLVDAGIEKVDLLSVDVEGGEVGVLQSIDLREFRVGVVIVENNYRSWRLPRHLYRQGYQLLCRIGWDEVYAPQPLRLEQL